MTADRPLSLDEVLAYIPRLPERQAEAMRLVVVEQLTQREAAGRMGIHQKSLTNLLERARNNLRHDIEFNKNPETA